MRSAVTAGPRPAARLRSTLLAAALAAAVLAGPLSVTPARAAPVEPTPSAAATETSPPSAGASATIPASARLTHGPNCVDGFVDAQVTAGSDGGTFALAYDGATVGAQVTLAAGGTAELAGPEVAPGAAVTVTVEVTTTAGAGSSLGVGRLVRPTQAECDAVLDPPSSSPTATPTAPSADPAPPTSSTPSSPPSTSVPSAPSSSGPSATTPRPTPGAPAPTAGSAAPSAPSTPSVPGTSSSRAGGSSSSGQVSPGSVVTIRGSGFTPGEQVTVTLAGAAEPLATVTADDLGVVEAVVQIPPDTDLGAAVVRLVGVASAQTAGVDLEIAAVEVDAAGSAPWPLLAAGLGLLGVAVALASAATRRPRRDDWQAPGAAS